MAQDAGEERHIPPVSIDDTIKNKYLNMLTARLASLFSTIPELLLGRAASTGQEGGQQPIPLRGFLEILPGVFDGSRGGTMGVQQARAHARFVLCCMSFLAVGR